MEYAVCFDTFENSDEIFVDDFSSAKHYASLIYWAEIARTGYCHVEIRKYDSRRKCNVHHWTPTAKWLERNK